MSIEENVCAKALEGTGEERNIEGAKNTLSREKDCPTSAPTVLKKFKSVDALARAYGALEAEFTRRSQRMKELEKTVDNLKENLATVSRSGAEKLRKNAEARRVATKEFDKFVEEIAKVSAEDKAETENKADLDLEVAPAQENLGEPAKNLVESEGEGLEGCENGQEQTEVTKETEGEKEVAKAGAEEEIGEESEGKGAFSAPVAKGSAEVSSEELYALASGDEQVRLKIIGEYLASIGRVVPPLTVGGRGTMASPPLKARNIADAGNLALQYFKKPFSVE